MIAITFNVILCIILTSLGLLHFSWALGGNWGFIPSLPTKENGELLFLPKKRDSAIVGFGLLFFGFYYFTKLDLIPLQLPLFISKYAGWIIPSIFLLRSIGEFKYVGFFKKVNSSDFAENDNKIFSPLCLVISIKGFVLQLELI